VDWGAGDDPCAVAPGSFAGCSCDPSDSFVIGGSGASASVVTQVGNLDLVGASTICVRDDGWFTANVVAQGRALRIVTGSGTSVSGCNKANGLHAVGNAVVVLQGAYLQPRAGAPTWADAPDTSSYVTAGGVVPCAGDCASTPHLVRFEYPSSPPGFSISDYVAAVDPNTDVLCFFDPHPDVDVWAAVDVNHCYRIAAVGAAAPYSIDIDITQKVHTAPDPYPRTIREVQCGSLAADVVPGVRWVQVPDGAIDPVFHRAGRWLRLEASGSFEATSYKILAEERGVCSLTSDWRCSEDHQCPWGESCIVTGDDWIQIGDTRGIASAHSSSDSAEDEFCVDYGHAPGDPFFVYRPIEITTSATPDWPNDPVSVDLDGAASHVDGVFVHRMTTFGVTGGTVLEWYGVTAFDMDGSASILIGESRDPSAVVDADLGLTSVAGGYESDPGTTTSHGTFMCTSDSLVHDWSVRYRGDDCFNTCGSNQNFEPQLFERIRCAFVANDNGVAQQSGNFVGKNDREAFTVVVDGVCDQCTTGDGGSGGLFSEISGCVPDSILSASGILSWGSYGVAGTNLNSVVQDVMMLGHRQTDSATGWPIRKVGSLTTAGSWSGFVFRDNWLTTASRQHPHNVVGMDSCYPLDGVGRAVEYRDGIVSDNRWDGAASTLSLFRNGQGPEDPPSLYSNLLVADNDKVTSSEAHVYNTVSHCSIGSGTMENVTFANGDAHTPSTELMWRITNSTVACDAHDYTGLVFYGQRNAPGMNQAAYFFGNPLLSGDPEIFPPGAAFCFENNDLDLEPGGAPTGGNLQLVQGVSLGLADPSTGRYDPTPGSMAEAFDCGVRSAGQEAGIRQFRWMHALSRLEPELQGAPVMDSDFDGSSDPIDNCIFVPNRNQEDNGGVGWIVPDGVGDVCQCGDADLDASVQSADVLELNACLEGAAACEALCDGTNDGACTAADITAIQLALSGLGSLSCSPPLPF
jgi:hypothetical protein